MSDTDELFRRGYQAHCKWESRRKDENECDAERRMNRVTNWLKVNLPPAYFEGWLERSDEWRGEGESMTSLTITIPHPPKPCKPNVKCHWAAKAKAVKKFRSLAHLATLEALAGRAPERWRKATVHIVAYCKTSRHQDPDNIVASLKAAFDGAGDAQIFVNDKDLWPSRPVFKKDPQNPRIELTFEEEI